MDEDDENEKISDILKNHEMRIENLEKKVSGSEEVTLPIRKTIKDNIIYLKQEGFFDDPKHVKEIISRLGQEGFHYPPESLTAPLQRIVKKGLLGRIKKDNKWAYCKR